MQKANESCLQASYKIAYRIALNKKPHTIGEYLSRICEISADILATVISEIKESPMFALQLDESADVALCSQLLVFTRYIKDDNVKEEYLFGKSVYYYSR